jgi:precorrin-2 dehydrogenase/sirohydrochlorin ferrochelatase
MLPVLLSGSTKVGLAGRGDGLGRRAGLLLEAGVSPTLLPTDAEEAALRGLNFLFIAGLDQDEAFALAARARSVGVLVNAEDLPGLCDFHVPAVVRRGDMILTASTGGRAPGLARRLREWLESHFGPEWKDRVDTVGRSREAWRAEGLSASEISRRTSALVAERAWLP